MSDNQAPVQYHGCQNFTVPGRVTTGVPVQRTSILVVCPLHKGVSRQTSANCPRLTCSSLAATLLKRILPGGRPSCWAAACRLGSPTAGKRSSHNTELGTCFSICWESVLWKFASSCKAFYFSVQSVAWYYWVSRLQYRITVLGLCWNTGNYSCSRTNCLLMWNSMVPSPCSQKPDNGPHPEPAETITYFHILFFSDQF